MREQIKQHLLQIKKELLPKLDKTSIKSREIPAVPIHTRTRGRGQARVRLFYTFRKGINYAFQNCVVPAKTTVGSLSTLPWI